MDLKKILADIENADVLVKQIESEIGKEFVPRTEFNTKNQELKERDTQLAELKASHDELATKTSDYDKKNNVGRVFCPRSLGLKH